MGSVFRYVARLGGGDVRSEGMIHNALAGIAVRDLKVAREYYSRIIGRPPDHEPRPELLEWQFPGGGALQVFLNPEGDRAGKCSVTLVVDDLQSEKDRVGQAGKETHTELVDTLILRDPEGNQVVLAQPKSTRLAR